MNKQPNLQGIETISNVAKVVNKYAEKENDYYILECDFNENSPTTAITYLDRADNIIAILAYIDQDCYFKTNSKIVNTNLILQFSKQTEVASLHFYDANTNLTIRGNVKFTTGLFLNAKSCCITDKIDTKSFVLHAQVLNNFGTISSHRHFDLNVEDTVTNHPNAIMSLTLDEATKREPNPPMMLIKANSLWNAGKITANTRFSIELNHFLVNGFSELPSIRNIANAYNNADITGEKVNIVAAVAVSIGGQLNAIEKMDISSLVSVILTNKQCSQFNVSSLISINSGVLVPNFANIGSYLYDICTTDFYKLSTAVFDQSNLFTFIGLLSSALKLFLPQVGTGLNICWNAFLFACELPEIIHSCRNIFAKESLQLREMIPFILKCRSSLLLATETYSHSNRISSLPWYGVELSKESLLKASISLGLSYAPGTRKESLLDISYELRFTGTSQNSALISYTGGAELAGNITHHFKTAHISGYHVANSLTLDGEHLEINGNLIADEAYISASYLAQLSGEMKLNHAVIDAVTLVQSEGARLNTKALITVQEQAVLKGESKLQDVILQANAIDYRGKTEVTGQLMITADTTLTTSENSVFFGNTGTLALKSKDGAYEGYITTQNVIVENPQINYEAYLKGEGQFAKIAPTGTLGYISGQSLNLGDISRNCGLSVTGSSIEVTGPIYSNQSVALISAIDNLVINANVIGKDDLYLSSAKDLIINQHLCNSGKETVCEAKGNFLNQGGVINGSESYVHAGGTVTNYGNVVGSAYLQVSAGDSINNKCTVIPYFGPNDVMMAYTPGQFIGGTGEKNDGIGLVLHSDNKICLEGSNVTAYGDVQIYAKQGIESTVLTHVYVSNKLHRKKGPFRHRKKTTTTIDTQVQATTIASANGRIVIASEQSEISLTATNILSNYGMDAYANAEIKIFDVRAVSITNIHESSGFGLNRKKQKMTEQISVPSVISNIGPGVTRLHSNESITLCNTEIYTPGITEITAAKQINLSLETLQHNGSSSFSGYDVSAFNVSLLRNQERKMRLQKDSTLTHIQQLANSHGALESALNTLSTATEIARTLNTIHNVSEGYTSLASALSGRYLGGNVYNPPITLTKKRRQAESTCESAGRGYLYTGELHLTAGESIEIKGMPTYVAGDMLMQAPKVIQKGLLLRSEFSDRSSVSSLSFTANAIARPSVDYSHHNTKMHAGQHLHLEMYVGGKLTVNVNTWEIKNAQINVGALVGEVEDLWIETQQNTFSSRSVGYNFSSNGHIDYQHARQASTKIDKGSSIHVRGDLGENLHIGHITLTGANITADGKCNLTNTITIYDVNHNFEKSKIVGIGLNITDLWRLWPHTKLPRTKIINPLANQTSQVIEELKIIYSVEHNSDIQHPVVHGDSGTNITGQINGSGNLMLDLAYAKEVKPTKSQHYHAQLPLPTANNLVQLENAWKFVTHQAPSEKQTQLFRAMNKLFGFTDEKKARHEVENMLLLSQIVYQDDLGRKALAKKSLQLVDTYHDANTSTHVGVYLNVASNEVYIAFRGTDSITAVLTDDKDIVFGNRLTSLAGDAFRDFMKDVMSNYNPSEFSYYATGHSRGAAQASVLSSEYGIPALVFDNPGLVGGDLSRVLSLQSTETVVTGFGKSMGYKYGHVWQLGETMTDSLKNMLLAMAYNQPGFGILAASAQQIESHKIDNIASKVVNDLSKQTLPKLRTPMKSGNSFFTERSPNASPIIKQMLMSKKPKPSNWSFFNSLWNSVYEQLTINPWQKKMKQFDCN